MRGGSWRWYLNGLLRCSYRYFGAASNAGGDIGFRVARSQ